MKNNHLVYYLFLVTVLVLGFLLIWRLGPNRNLQMFVLILLSILYAGIGIVHHLIDHDLVGKIVVEYILIALLGIAAAFFIFRGGFGF